MLKDSPAKQRAVPSPPDRLNELDEIRKEIRRVEEQMEGGRGMKTVEVGMKRTTRKGKPPKNIKGVEVKGENRNILKMRKFMKDRFKGEKRADMQSLAKSRQSEKDMCQAEEQLTTATSKKIENCLALVVLPLTYSYTILQILYSIFCFFFRLFKGGFKLHCAF